MALILGEVNISHTYNEEYSEEVIASFAGFKAEFDKVVSKIEALT